MVVLAALLEASLGQTFKSSEEFLKMSKISQIPLPRVMSYLAKEEGK